MMRGPSVSEEARALHFSTPVVDLHADTAMLMRLGYDLAQRHAAFLPRGAFGFHVDLPRLREGGVAGQFFGLVPLPRRGRAAKTVASQLAALEAAVARNPDEIVFARSLDEVVAARATGRVAALLGVEGGHALEGKVEAVEALARRGVGYLGLLHFSANEIGAPARGLGQDESRGLSSFGHAVIEAAEACGVIIDLAHINRRGFLEASARCTRSPIVSHTGVSQVHAMWRNIDDDQIRAVADKGGIIGIIFAPVFLGRDGLDAVIDHLLHVVSVGGVDVPALGSDYDGFIVPASGLRDVSFLPGLTEALLRRRVAPETIRKILGENALRLLAAVPPRLARAAG